ncbi:hypothetical protein BX600DRAFT_43029 [Xylariales sp. PMI_506]|nr:hypothetical protein BX600DRAFT_43029 [Xylariales sp. PMI_506]
MIRNPINAAVGRGRPDLCRLSEGIATSLRQFSIAQARCNDDPPQRPTGRQRSAAAANELLSINRSAKSTSTKGRGDSPHRTAEGNAAPIRKVISISSLRGGVQGRFTGLKLQGVPSGSPARAPSPGPGSGAATGNIIRGGFRGRGGAGRGGPAGRGGAFRGGRGGLRGPDDRPRPQRARKSGKKRNDDENYKRFMNQEDEDPALAEYFRKVEVGPLTPYKPLSSDKLLADLAGYVPAIAAQTSLTPGSTAVLQARTLGGGGVNYPQDWKDPEDAKKRYTEGNGTFFPSIEAKRWTEKVTQMEFKAPPKETTTAVLEAALLGKYEGPNFALENDTLGTVRNYVRRDGSWNMASQSTIEEKVKSLLPSAPKGGAGAPRAKGDAGTTKAKGKRA